MNKKFSMKQVALIAIVAGILGDVVGVWGRIRAMIPFKVGGAS